MRKLILTAAVAIAILMLAPFTEPLFAQAPEVVVSQVGNPGINGSPGEPVPTSGETGDALQAALAAYAGIAMTGDQTAEEVARLEAALAEAMTRAENAVENAGASAASVHGAYEDHISTLVREHASAVGELRTEQAEYVARE